MGFYRNNNGVIENLTPTAPPAIGIQYDNTSSELEATNVQDAVDEIVSSLFLKVYPIGSIYFSVNNTNPGELFGGTWVSWGSGRVPVGVDTSDSNFDTVEKVVGENYSGYTPSGSVSQPTFTGTAASLSHSGGAVQNHTLTINQIPNHNHVCTTDTAAKALSTTVEGGSKVGDINWDGGLYWRNYTLAQTNTGDTGGGQAHSHGFTQPSAHSYTPTGTVSKPSFVGTETNISTIQKSITCYMWKRVS